MCECGKREMWRPAEARPTGIFAVRQRIHCDRLALQSVLVI